MSEVAPGGLGRPRPRAPIPRAVVFCEGNFGLIDGKTANGLVRHSERYEVSSVIDSTSAGGDGGQVLDGRPNGIPVVGGLDAALDLPGPTPEHFIIGVAPTRGFLSDFERAAVLDAMSRGLNIVNGLHEFLNDDPEFASSAVINGVAILDVRRPPEKKDLQMFSGRILGVHCPRIAVLGTDGAIGKRTTATILTRALRDAGIGAEMVATGQTGLIQGTKYGVALDAVPAQFVTGELEAAVVEAFEEADPEVIVVEGQGALSHPTYLSSTAILRGSLPEAVILQHAPARKTVSDFPQSPMPTAQSEINLIETFADTRVIGITINHENMTDAEVSSAITAHELQLGIPVTDALTRPTWHLLEMVYSALPQLRHRRDAADGVTMPCLEVDFGRLGGNAELLVSRAAELGISVTGVTKAMLGDERLAEVLVEAGVESLGDSRVESIEKLRAAGQVCPMFLLRSPAPSQVPEVVRSGAVSLNTETDVVELLSAAARTSGVVHSIMVMVELGDLREGVMPDLLEAWTAKVLSLPNIELVGIGANLACRSGIAPDASNMARLSECATGLEEAFGIDLEMVSGGNSASVTWAFEQSGSSLGRVNNLRLGEAILLGRDPLTGEPIAGASLNAFTLVGEVIESARKPGEPWGRRCRSAFGEGAVVGERGDVWQTIVALGHQDTDPAGLTPPPGIVVVGASSDHLVTETECRTRPGTRIRFRPNYAALLRSVTCPFVPIVVVG